MTRSVTRLAGPQGTVGLAFLSNVRLLFIIIKDLQRSFIKSTA